MSKIEFSGAEITDALVRFYETPSQGIILGGANLVIRGMVSETGDIDILVPEEEFETMRSWEGAHLIPPPQPAMRRGAINDTIKFGAPVYGVPVGLTTSLGDGYYPMTYRDQAASSQAVHIEGGTEVVIQDLSELITSKTALRRRKDIEHLHQIRYKTCLSFPIPLAEVNPIAPNS